LDRCTGRNYDGHFEFFLENGIENPLSKKRDIIPQIRSVFMKGIDHFQQLDPQNSIEVVLIKNNENKNPPKDNFRGSITRNFKMALY